MMKKNFILPLLAAASLTGVAQGALSDDQGNWSIVLDLKTDKILDVIDGKLGAETGVNLVQWKGDSDFEYNETVVGAPVIPNCHGTATDRYVSYWIGWGGAYFPDLGSGLPAGLQMGFAGGTTSSVGDTHLSSTPNLDTGGGLSNAGYYRADTKYDVYFDWVQDDVDGKVMNDLKTTFGSGNEAGVTITGATLALVHNNEISDPYEFRDGSTAPHSQTLQYLSITGEYIDENNVTQYITITYIASVDDEGLYHPETLLGNGIAPSSNRYDVDDLKNVWVNGEYVDSYLVTNEALSAEDLKNGTYGPMIGIPEPTSATLSMMALTALCARRRRRK